MLMRKCPRCGKVIKQGDPCCSVSEKNKEYDRFHRNKESRAVYKDKRWEVARKQCREKANDIDLFYLYKNKKIKKGTLAHHIVEVTEDKEKAYDVNNLVWLTEASHAAIHKAYNISRLEKIKMQKLLLKLKNSYEGVGQKV